MRSGLSCRFEFHLICSPRLRLSELITSDSELWLLSFGIRFKRLPSFVVFTDDSTHDDITQKSMHRPSQRTENEQAGNGKSTEARVSRIEDTLEAELGDIESRLAQTMETSAEVSDHLLNSLEALEREVANLGDELESLRSTLHESVDRRPVADLKQSANRAGIDSAICQSCDDTVLVGLLERAECPHCKSQFADVKSDSGWLFTRHYLIGGAATGRSA